MDVKELISHADEWVRECEDRHVFLCAVEKVEEGRYAISGKTEGNNKLLSDAIIHQIFDSINMGTAFMNAMLKNVEEVTKSHREEKDDD